MTLIKTVGLAWSSVHRRWMFAREMLSTQGFPTAPVLVRAAVAAAPDTPDIELPVLTSFNVPRTGQSHRGSPMPERRPTTMCSQAGNTMNVNVIGAALLYQFGFQVRCDIALRLS